MEIFGDDTGEARRPGSSRGVQLKSALSSGDVLLTRTHTPADTNLRRHIQASTRALSIQADMWRVRPRSSVEMEARSEEETQTWTGREQGGGKIKNPLSRTRRCTLSCTRQDNNKTLT